MSEFKRDPVARQAVQDFLSAGFKPGDMVPHGWLEKHFDMDTLGEDEGLTASEFQARQFEWLANIEAFKQELLVEHQVCLQNVRGKGYRWVPVREQTDFAMGKFQSDVRRTFRDAGQRLHHLRHLELTDDERRKHVDATAKIAALSGMTRKALS